MDAEPLRHRSSFMPRRRNAPLDGQPERNNERVWDERQGDVAESCLAGVRSAAVAGDGTVSTAHGMCSPTERAYRRAPVP